ncbi:MAG: hypothetical protein WCQ99_13995 [Pseudomonadota bacterium]
MEQGILAFKYEEEKKITGMTALALRSAKPSAFNLNTKKRKYLFPVLQTADK